MALLLCRLKKLFPLTSLALLCACVSQILTLFDPLIFQRIVDNYALRNTSFSRGQFLEGVGLLLALATGLMVGGLLFKSVQVYCVTIITQKVASSLYADGIAHLLQLPFHQLEDLGNGKTLEMLQRMRTDVEQFLTVSVNIFLSSLIGLIFIGIYAYRVHWLIAPTFLAAAPTLTVVSLLLSRRVKAVEENILNAGTALAGATTESLRNIELVRSHGLAVEEIGRLNEANNRLLGLELQKARSLRALTILEGTLVNTLHSVILLIMLFLIFEKAISVGQYFSLFLYSFLVFSPMQEIPGALTIYRQAQASLNELKVLLEIPHETKVSEAKELGRLTKLSFRQVYFKYEDAMEQALRDVSFTVQAGETIAFVGPSGAGKTTLIKLLLQLYEPTAGTIEFNDCMASRIDPDHMRRQVGIVSQHTQIFSGSIRDNLRLVKPDASDQDCLALLNAVSPGFMRRSNFSLDARLGEGGLKLSGGERQRLSIARALLRQPQVLVFDEPTSSLDPRTEEDVATAIREITKESQRITVLITHRLRTSLYADRIYVLENGSIIEQGTHEELLNNLGLYHALWRLEDSANSRRL